MNEQVEYFENRFSALVIRTFHNVRERQVEPSMLLVRVTTLRVSDRVLHRSFIEKHLVDIPPPVTFEKIWTRLCLYWDMLNYGLLQHVINILGSDELKYQMLEYVDELSEFKKRTLLCDFIDSWPFRDVRKPGLKKVVIKMSLEWSQCTLHDIESFKTALLAMFFLPEYDIILQMAARGCVCVTWLTFPSVVSLLQQNLAKIATELFKEHKIESVTIGELDFHPSPISGYLREQDTSEKPMVGVSPPMPAEKFHPLLIPGTSEEAAVKTLTLAESPHFQYEYSRQIRHLGDPDPLHRFSISGYVVMNTPFNT